MRTEIKWGGTIHNDGTITKYEIIHCDDEREFWQIYDESTLGDTITTANVKYLTIQTKTYATVEEYRNRVIDSITNKKICGDD